MKNVRNWGAERLVDGGRRCTVLPALHDIDISVSGGFRHSDVKDMSPKDAGTPPAVVRQKQQQSFVERMHRGRDRSVELCGPPDILEEVRLLISPREPDIPPKVMRHKASGQCKSMDSSAVPNFMSEVRQSVSLRAPCHAALPSKSAQRVKQEPQQYPAVVARALNVPLGEHAIHFKRRGLDPHELFDSVLPHDEWSVVRRRAPVPSKKWNPLSKLEPVRIVCDPASARVRRSERASQSTDKAADEEVAGVAAKSSSHPFNPNQRQSRRSETPASDSIPFSSQHQSKKHEILERVPPEANISLERRSACEGLRMLVFGRILIEQVSDEKRHAHSKEGDADSKEKNSVFQEGIGTKETVLRLFKFWLKLDYDRSGRMKVTELQEHVHQRGASATQKAAGDKVIAFLIGRSCKAFSFEDVMRIVWPASTAAQLKQMESWVAEYLAHESMLVSEPRLLSEDERDALTRNFEHISSLIALEQNADLLDLPTVAARTVNFDALIKGSILDEGEAKKCCDVWDRGWNDDIDLESFLMMMCPSGFRPFEGAKAAVNDNGDRIILQDGSWRLKERPELSRVSRQNHSRMGNSSRSSRCPSQNCTRGLRLGSTEDGNSRCHSRLSNSSLS